MKWPRPEPGPLVTLKCEGVLEGQPPILPRTKLAAAFW